LKLFKTLDYKSKLQQDFFNMKKRIFIGSSSEEIGTAKIVKRILEKDFDVTIWDEQIWDKSVFKLNGNFLNDLLSATLKFDFGILIGSPDDRVISRGKEEMTARDNVLFELGLFIGRLGLDKCAFLVEKTVKIPSDFAGIKISLFDKNNLIDKIDEISQFFKKPLTKDLNFFPSSTLASTYYENFVKYVSEHYVNENGFTYKDKKYKECHFKIIIPNKISNNLNTQFKRMQNEIEVGEITFESNGRSRGIIVDASVQNDKLVLLDFPTTLTGINQAIKYLLPKEYDTQGKDYELILNRELEKFVVTLSSIIKINGFSDFISIVREDSLKTSS